MRYYNHINKLSRPRLLIFRNQLLIEVRIKYS